MHTRALLFLTAVAALGCGEAAVPATADAARAYTATTNAVAVDGSRNATFTANAAGTYTATANAVAVDGSRNATFSEDGVAAGAETRTAERTPAFSAMLVPPGSETPVGLRATWQPAPGDN